MKTEQINIRISKEMKELLKTKAEEHGLGMSAYIMLLLKKGKIQG